jgi:hypothetical protein
MGVAFACGSSDDAPIDLGHIDALDTTRSGTRLRVKGLEIDGIFVPQNFFDTKLGIDCFVTVDPVLGGPPACYPINTSGIESNATEQEPRFFTQPDCTQEIVTLPNGDCPSGRRAGLILRFDDRMYFRYGPRVTPAAQIYRSASGACTPVAPDPARDYFTIGEAVPRSEFVLFDRTATFQIVFELGGSVLLGRDGSWGGTKNIIDRVHNVPCSLGRTEDGYWRCLPAAADIIGPSCPNVATVSGSCPGASCGTSFASETIDSPDRCAPSATHVFELGEELPRTACAGDWPADIRFFAVGPRVGDDRFPQLLDTYRPHTRISEHIYTDGVPIFRPIFLRDETLGAECLLQLAADGKTRCLSTEKIAPEVAFSDASCTTPIATSELCQDTIKWVTAGVTDDACSGLRYHQYEAVAAPVTFTFGQTQNGCVAESTDRALFRRGNEVPPESFVEATPVTR